MMQQMPERKPNQFQHNIKNKCVVCGDKFNFISATFVPICNNCRRLHKPNKEGKNGNQT